AGLFLVGDSKPTQLVGSWSGTAELGGNRTALQMTIQPDGKVRYTGLGMDAEFYSGRVNRPFQHLDGEKGVLTRFSTSHNSCEFSFDKVRAAGVQFHAIDDFSTYSGQRARWTIKARRVGEELHVEASEQLITPQGAGMPVSVPIRMRRK